LDQTARQPYDVIFLDVQMPGMDGFELCKKIHEAGPNRATPVVFVTNHSDFEARAKSTLVGGNDLMAKPFLIFEITAKALTLAWQGRLLAHEPDPAGQTGPARKAAEPAALATAPAPSAAAPEVAGRPLTPIRKVRTGTVTEAFVNRVFEHLEPLRELGKNLLEAADVATRQTLLTDGFLRINSLTANAREVTHPAYQLCAALEGLVRKLLQDATRATPSALATVATAVDLLDDLCAPGLRADLAVNPPVRLLVVDDDLVARRALAGALQTVFEKPANAGDGETAFALARGEPYDVIFLDLQMPGLDGFETCSKIRETGCNRETPVVFVTGRTDYAARAEAFRTPGTDLVEKPFLTAEINLKALTFALRGRLQPAEPAPAG
jgi:CheY-like chemotaxis protein